MTLFLTNDVTDTQTSSHRDPVSRNPSDLAGGKTCVSSARHTLHVKQIVSCFSPATTAPSKDLLPLGERQRHRHRCNNPAAQSKCRWQSKEKEKCQRQRWGVGRRWRAPPVCSAGGAADAAVAQPPTSTSSTPPPHHNLLPLQGFVTFKMLGLLRGGVAEEKKFK